MPAKQILKKALGIKEKSHISIVQLKSDEAQAVIHAVGKKIQQRLVDLEVENKKLKSRISEFDKKRIKEQKNQDKSVQNLLEKERSRIDHYVKSKKIKILFDIKGKKTPVLFSKSNIYSWNIIGFSVQDTDDGIILYQPLVKDKKGKIRELRVYSTDFESFFRNPTGIVNQILVGKVDSNIEVTRIGKKLVLMPEGGVARTAEEVDAQREMADMKDYMKKLNSKIIGMQDELKEKDKLINTLKLDTSEAEKTASVNLALAENQLVKTNVKTEELGKTQAELQDSKLNQLMTERLSYVYEALADQLTEKVEKYGIDKNAFTKEELMDIYNQAITTVRSIEKPQVIIQPIAQPQRPSIAQTLLPKQQQTGGQVVPAK